MSVALYELQNGDMLIVDANAPRSTLSRDMAVKYPEVRRRAVERVEWEIAQVKVKAAQERAKTLDAQFEREALFAYLEVELTRYMGVGGALKQFFNMVGEALPHHRVKR